MEKTSMNIRVDVETKKKAQVIFSELGMDMTTAVNIFLRKVVRENGFPFDLRLDGPNAATLAAFVEGERMLHDPSAPRFSSVDALFQDLNAE